MDQKLNTLAMEQIIESIPIMINEKTKEELTNKMTKQEVINALFSMQKEKAPGLDGFQEGFFHLNLDIISNDVVEVVANFFKR